MHSSKSESNAPSPCSDHSSPGPYFRTNPDEYCQNCKSEISAGVLQLPCPVQYFDFITECPSPWLHYGYCTPCLENARIKDTKIIIEHISQCEALYGQCWENEHENHILHYQHTETKNIWLHHRYPHPSPVQHVHHHEVHFHTSDHRTSTSMSSSLLSTG